MNNDKEDNRIIDITPASFDSEFWRLKAKSKFNRAKRYKKERDRNLLLGQSTIKKFKDFNLKFRSQENKRIRLDH